MSGDGNPDHPMLRSAFKSRRVNARRLAGSLQRRGFIPAPVKAYRSVGGLADQRSSGSTGSPSVCPWRT